MLLTRRGIKKASQQIKTHQERDWKDAPACLCYRERTAFGECPIAGLEPEATFNCGKIVFVLASCSRPIIALLGPGIDQVPTRIHQFHPHSIPIPSNSNIQFQIPSQPFPPVGDRESRCLCLVAMLDPGDSNQQHSPSHVFILFLHLLQRPLLQSYGCSTKTNKIICFLLIRIATW